MLRSLTNEANLSAKQPNITMKPSTTTATQDAFYKVNHSHNVTATSGFYPRAISQVITPNENVPRDRGHREQMEKGQEHSLYTLDTDKARMNLYRKNVNSFQNARKSHN